MGGCCCCARRRSQVSDIRAVVAESESGERAALPPDTSETPDDVHNAHEHCLPNELKTMGNESSRGTGPGSGSRSSKLSIGKKGPSVKELMERAEKTGVLKASKGSLKEYPPQLVALAASLRSLDLADNRIPLIPPSIGDFGLLKQLHLDNNRLGSLPDEIGRLKKLEVLTVAGNELTAVPETLVGCLALKNLSVASNQLSAFPVALCGLPSLEMADLSCNQLTSLPDAVAGCRAIELNLNRNQIADLNGDRLAEAPRLKVLRLEENVLALNQLTQRLLEESKISLLTLDGNLFQERDVLEAPGYDVYQERYTASKKKMY